MATRQPTAANPASPAPRSPSFASHPRAVIALHWLSALVLVGVFALVLSRELLEDDAPRAALLKAHRVLGLLVGSITLLRLGTRLRSRLADTTGHCALWQRVLAHGLHAGLYLLLLSLPLLGWALTSARGQMVELPLLGHLPALLERDLDLADTLESWHAGVAWTLAGAIGAHLGAALLHHFFHRDGVLLAMLPLLRRRGVNG
jgi:cytochrome b561